ncbi:LUD domain-containing protein [Chloroflexi bacterium TSY]|nr:LUD domain-containing protein [Chloroflexi bacterium TSY]MBV7331981.1 LUD domain-containing protein [Chloroflexi bacterium TSY]MBV7334195.1 LUD domain-containing protein [Chloroflexi bacterium TSY]
MSARDDILNKLRNSLDQPTLRFPSYDPQPLSQGEQIVVAEARGDLEMLAERFGSELEALHGSYELASSVAAARMALIRTIQTWIEEEASSRKGAREETGFERSILGWSAAQLLIPGIGEALADLELNLISPDDLTTAESRESVRQIRIGVTSVEAAIASTGTMLMLSSSPGTNRSASLLPYRHVALIPFSRLYPTIESWLAKQRQGSQLVEMIRHHANLSLISGPSKSADIEGALTLGVHGPRFVHAILFDD